MEHYNIFTVTKIPQSNTKPERVKIESPRLGQKVVISMTEGKALPTALVYLKSKGFEFKGDAEGKKCNYLISTTFKDLS